MDSIFKKIDKTVDLDYIYSLLKEENSSNIYFRFDNIFFEFNHFTEVATALNIDVSLIKRLWLIQPVELSAEKEFAFSENYKVAICLPSLNTHNTLILKINDTEVECLVDKPILFLSTTPARFKIPDVQSVMIGFSDSIINISDIEPLLI